MFLVKIMKFLTYLFFSLFFISSLFVNLSYAQNTGEISGSIIDENTKELIDFASIALFQEDNNTYVAGVQSDLKGNFLFSNLADGSYLLKITFVGYQDYEKGAIQIKDGRRISLGIISLNRDQAQVLNEVVIEGQAPTMQLGIDRKVFNVAQSVISAGGSATDLLSDIPSLSVDMDGAVSLRGTSGVQILIDGKPSTMGGDISQLLQSMPANTIDRVEVITNPSSKYEADGQSGIINIVLKKNIQTGFNGMVNLSGGSYNNYNGGLNINYRDNRFNYFGSYNYRRGNRIGDGFNYNQSLLNNGITENTSESSRKGDNHRVRLGLDYYLNDKNTIGISGGIDSRDNNRIENIFYMYQNQPSLNGTSTRVSDQKDIDFGFDFSVDYKREFTRKGEELVANFSYGKSTEDGSQSFDQQFSNENQDIDRRLNDNDEDDENINIQLDYVLPFGEDTRLEAGYRTNIRNSNETQLSDSFDPLSNSFIRDYDLSNGFKMQDVVHAIYGNYQNKITPTLGYQLGLRLEQAYLNTEYIALYPSIPENERFTKGKLDYLRLYPSLFVTQKLSDDQQLQVSYTRRVRRPRGWQVNPFKDVSDPMNIRMGNANLLPEDIHSFELSYAKFWPKITFTSSIYHRRVNDVIENIRTSADEQTSATLSQWLNLSKREATGFEMISKVNFNKNIDATANFNFFYNKFHGSEEFNLPARDGYNWDANLSSNVKITSLLSAQVKGNYYAPRLQAQGRTNSSFVVDAGLKLDVLDKKGSILFNVRDLFNQRMWSGYTETEQFTQHFENRWMRRSFMLSFNYRFGKQDFNAKNNRRDQSDNDDMGGMEMP
jgi:outer membrane receptor for ferrienterochelin and colicin